VDRFVGGEGYISDGVHAFRMTARDPHRLG